MKDKYKACRHFVGKQLLRVKKHHHEINLCETMIATMHKYYKPIHNSILSCGCVENTDE